MTRFARLSGVRTFGAALMAGMRLHFRKAALNTRLRELAVQDLNAAFLDANQEAAITAEENSKSFRFYGCWYFCS